MDRPNDLRCSIEAANPAVRAGLAVWGKGVRVMPSIGVHEKVAGINGGLSQVSMMNSEQGQLQTI
jgi:hypothetical protein